MCGIAGFSSDVLAVNGTEIMTAMLDKIISRGPDDWGQYVDGHGGIGMRRLSITGVRNGKQPILNEDQTMALVFNGEIYNYKELRTALKKKGHIFSTETDSEVILHGYEEYGKEILKKLRGMFAFAVWDFRDQSMFLGRDPFGIKPLFYQVTPGERLVFASEIKAILSVPGEARELNEQALASYLAFQYNPLEETFYRGIYQLLPGHSAMWKGGRLQIEEYWDMVWKPDKSKSEAELVKQTALSLKDSVKSHMIGDVEIGTFLSGGIDSSVVAALSKVKKAFSVGFEEEGYSEIEKAAELCKRYGITHYTKKITREEFWDSTGEILDHLDEPVADPSIIPLNFLCKLASEHVKVVLSGEGADELFGGYPIYGTAMALKPVEWIPEKVRRGVRRIVEKIPFSFKGKQYLIRAGQRVEERFIGDAYIFHEDEIRRVLKVKDGVSLDPTEVTRPYYDRVKGQHELTKMQYIDTKLWMRGDILRKSDHISMGHSLEVRVPFLDPEVARAASAIPPHYRVTKHTTKYILRGACNGLLSKQEEKRKKLGFPVPVKKWLREEPCYLRVKQVFDSAAAGKFFDQSYLTDMLEEHKVGKADNARKIWTVYLFLLWYQKNFEEIA